MYFCRLTDADRRKPPKIGSIITYRFQEYTLDGVPRFPTFVGKYLCSCQADCSN